MPALVTGCAGFIGSHLAESLLADGHEVLGVDCFNDNYGRAQKLLNLKRAKDWDAFEFVPLDLSRGALFDLVAECDVVFHLAAEPGVRSSWGGRFDQYLRNNVLATQHLLEAAKACGDTRVVYASSSSVYGDAAQLPTPEDAPCNPFSPYGVTKLAAEALCQLYHGNYGLPTVALRYFSVYGPRQRPDMGFNRFCRAVAEGESVTVFGDGEQTRDFTYVADVVRATRAAAVTPAAAGRIYNIGGGSTISLNGTLELLAEISGETIDIRRLEREHGDVRDTAADISRAAAELGFAPQTSIAEGLAAEYEWTLENRAELASTTLGRSQRVAAAAGAAS